MFGCAIVERIRWKADISTRRTEASRVLSVLSAPPFSTTRPSSSTSRDCRLGATRSTRPASSASSAENDRLSVTASSASFWSRPRRAASERAVAAASWVTLSPIAPGMSPPPPATGWAAPVFVPGAIAATSAPSRMKKPAEAAWEPLGET